ncbi:unnamed protein product, partial [Heterosigma akashiwo]
MVARNNNEDLGEKRWRQIRFRAFLFRDTFGVMVLLNLIIALLGLLIHTMDSDEQVLSAFSDMCFLPFGCHHKPSVYFLAGFLALLVILGSIALVLV